MNRLAVVAAAGVAVVGLAGCTQTVAPAFGPWPVGHGPTQLKPGLWATKDATPLCKWTLRNAGYSLTSSVTAVQIPDAPGVTFASSGCGTWRYISPGQWTPGDGPP